MHWKQELLNSKDIESPSGPPASGLFQTCLTFCPRCGGSTFPLSSSAGPKDSGPWLWFASFLLPASGWTHCRMSSLEAPFPDPGRGEPAFPKLCPPGPRNAARKAGVSKEGALLPPLHGAPHASTEVGRPGALHTHTHSPAPTSGPDRILSWSPPSSTLRGVWVSSCTSMCLHSRPSTQMCRWYFIFLYPQKDKGEHAEMNYSAWQGLKASKALRRRVMTDGHGHLGSSLQLSPLREGSSNRAELLHDQGIHAAPGLLFLHLPTGSALPLEASLSPAGGLAMTATESIHAQPLSHLPTIFSGHHLSSSSA